MYKLCVLLLLSNLSVFVYCSQRYLEGLAGTLPDVSLTNTNISLDNTYNIFLETAAVSSVPYTLYASAEQKKLVLLRCLDSGCTDSHSIVTIDDNLDFGSTGTGIGRSSSTSPVSISTDDTPVFFFDVKGKIRRVACTSSDCTSYFYGEIMQNSSFPANITIWRISAGRLSSGLPYYVLLSDDRRIDPVLSYCECSDYFCNASTCTSSFYSSSLGIRGIAHSQWVKTSVGSDGNVLISLVTTGSSCDYFPMSLYTIYCVDKTCSKTTLNKLATVSGNSSSSTCPKSGSFCPFSTLTLLHDRDNVLAVGSKTPKLPHVWFYNFDVKRMYAYDCLNMNCTSVNSYPIPGEIGEYPVASVIKGYGGIHIYTFQEPFTILSGGFVQSVSLARCVYANCTYLVHDIDYSGVLDTHAAYTIPVPIGYSYSGSSMVIFWFDSLNSTTATASGNTTSIQYELYTSFYTPLATCGILNPMYNDRMSTDLNTYWDKSFLTSNPATRFCDSINNYTSDVCLGKSINSSYINGTYTTDPDFQLLFYADNGSIAFPLVFTSSVLRDKLNPLLVTTTNVFPAFDFPDYTFTFDIRFDSVKAERSGIYVKSCPTSGVIDYSYLLLNGAYCSDLFSVTAYRDNTTSTAQLSIRFLENSNTISSLPTTLSSKLQFQTSSIPFEDFDVIITVTFNSGIFWITVSDVQVMIIDTTLYPSGLFKPANLLMLGNPSFHIPETTTTTTTDSNQWTQFTMGFIQTCVDVPSLKFLPSPFYNFTDSFSTDTLNTNLWNDDHLIDGIRYCPPYLRWLDPTKQLCSTTNELTTVPFGYTSKVQNNVLTLSTEGVNSTIFPWIYSGEPTYPSPFPTDSEDFIFSINIQFTSGLYPTGFSLLNCNDTMPIVVNFTHPCVNVISVLADAGRMKLYYLNSIYILPDSIPSDYVQFVIEYTSEVYYVYYSGRLIFGPTRSTQTPNTISLGSFQIRNASTSWTKLDIESIDIIASSYEPECHTIQSPTSSTTPVPTPVRPTPNPSPTPLSTINIPVGPSTPRSPGTPTDSNVPTDSTPTDSNTPTDNTTNTPTVQAPVQAPTGTSNPTPTPSYTYCDVQNNQWLNKIECIVNQLNREPSLKTFVNVTSYLCNWDSSQNAVVCIFSRNGSITTRLMCLAITNSLLVNGIPTKSILDCTQISTTSDISSFDTVVGDCMKDEECAYKCVNHYCMTKDSPTSINWVPIVAGVGGSFAFILLAILIALIVLYCSKSDTTVVTVSINNENNTPAGDNNEEDQKTSSKSSETVEEMTTVITTVTNIT
eukprot:TRINITY_DN4055_c0_g1_i2.p1 TRINITY_DN4055_c0_g1~~TRINITY_DN4055_c0_g1_i2.p1  ORF type:complete len:1288 (-),score=227.56 TRINITY_DN4055_c0_g1_i2:443-4306(-)